MAEAPQPWTSIVCVEPLVGSLVDLLATTLSSRRQTMSFGKDEVSYLFHLDRQYRDQDFHAILHLRVRKARSGQVIEWSVRSPDVETECSSYGCPGGEPVDNKTLNQLRGGLKLEIAEVVSQLNQPPTGPELIRRHVVCNTFKSIAAKYQAMGWTIAPLGISAIGYGEQLMICTKEFRRHGIQETILRATHEATELTYCLTVFWLEHFTVAVSDQVWTLERVERPDGEYRNARLQRGVILDTGGPMEETCPATDDVEFSEVDRLDCWTWPGGHSLRGSFLPPSDSADLFAKFESLGFPDRQRFLAAAKCYWLSLSLSKASPSGGLAFLVVVIETLMEADLPRCATCNQHTGLSSAFVNFVFERLPCLDSSAEARSHHASLLKRAYNRRSLLFHTGQFQSSELLFENNYGG